MSIAGDEKLVDALKSWGTITDYNISAIKWTNTFALLVAGSTDGSIRIFKWDTKTSYRLKMKTIEWNPVLEWQGYNTRCEVISLS